MSPSTKSGWERFRRPLYLLGWGLLALFILKRFLMPGTHPLLGKPAPAFQATLLDGTPMDLSASLGKEIIVLDFWAVWCPPCRRALPVIDEVAREYAPKGVRFYGVNQGDDPDKIKDFMQKQSLTLPMVIGAREPGLLYEVSGIPQTVIIGKNGLIQEVHVGASPLLGHSLRKSLDTLLSGKLLIEPE